jgi:hypothetical protein
MIGESPRGCPSLWMEHARKPFIDLSIMRHPYLKLILTTAAGIAGMIAYQLRSDGRRGGESAQPTNQPAISAAANTACDASYPDFCIPPPPPDLNCKDVTGPKPFHVRPPDPHGFDRDGDGWGCESARGRRRRGG